MGRAADRLGRSPTTRVLEGEGGRVAELAGELREAMVHDARTGGSWTPPACARRSRSRSRRAAVRSARSGWRSGAPGRSYGEAELGVRRAARRARRASRSRTPSSSTG